MVDSTPLQHPVCIPRDRQCGCGLFHWGHTTTTTFHPLLSAVQQHDDKIGSTFSCFTMFLFILNVESKWNGESGGSEKVGTVKKCSETGQLHEKLLFCTSI